MNNTTRIFIVLNLVLAICFALLNMVQFAYSENYKRRWLMETNAMAEIIKDRDRDVLQATFEAVDAKQAASRLNERIDTLARENNRLDTLLSERAGDLAAAELRNQKSQERIQSLEQQVEKMQESLNLAQNRRAELNYIAQVARQVAHQLQVKLAEVEDDLSNAETELNRREETITNMELDMRRKDAQLALVRERHPDVHREITSGEPPSDEVIRGVVAGIRDTPTGEQDLVILTVGRDDEVRDGMEFIIYRENQYIVRVRVIRLLNDMVACRVIPDTWNMEGARIQQGDAAQNRLLF